MLQQSWQQRKYSSLPQRSILSMSMVMQMTDSTDDIDACLQSWCHWSSGCCTQRCGNEVADWEAKEHQDRPDQLFSTTWLLWNQLSWRLWCSCSCSLSALLSSSNRTQMHLQLIHLVTGMLLLKLPAGYYVLELRQTRTQSCIHH